MDKLTFTISIRYDHEAKMWQSDDNKTHLCVYCQQSYPECTGMDIVFGDGWGSDNIVGCRAFTPPENAGEGDAC